MEMVKKTVQNVCFNFDFECMNEIVKATFVSCETDTIFNNEE